MPPPTPPPERQPRFTSAGLRVPPPASGAPRSPDGGHGSPSRAVGSFIVEIVKVIVISLAIIVPIRYFLIQPFYVKGASMEPTFHDNEYLIIDEISYRVGQPKRGDVVVLRNPRRETEFFIKRIIGLPGETVTVGDGGVTIANTDAPSGARLDEPYLPAGTVTSGNSRVTLSSSEYFVMGDNRPASLDSRSFGPIERRELIGRTWLRAWPPSRLSAFSTVQYTLGTSTTP